MSTQDLSSQDDSHQLPQAMGKPANAALAANGITTLEQLTGYTEKELLVMHGLGPKAIRILKAELLNLGLSFKN